MNKKKGFTLIELLAVIVILALIVIISVPKILDVIEKSERTAWGESAGLMAKAAELKYSEGSITNTESDETYEFENGDFKSGSPTLTFKGDKPYSGKIVQEKGKTTLALISKNKKWCAIKNTGERIAKVYKIGKEITEENCKIGYTGSDDKKDDTSSSGGSGSSGSSDSSGGSGEEATKIICKRATTLHTENCVHPDTTQCCIGTGYTETGSKGTTTITYGNLGTKGTLASGDAFDCDVNGDGTYDSTTERFYYVSDYFNTSTKKFENDTAVLIYYNNVSGGIASNSKQYAYGIANQSYNGPVIAKKQLPSQTQWNNIKLKHVVRKLLTEKSMTEVAGKALPNDFSYDGYAARLLTVEEVSSACNKNIISGVTAGILDNCNYFLENTYYSNSNIKCIDIWLENPAEYSKPTKASNIGSYDRGWGYDTITDSTFSGVRPAIEVSKDNIDY